MLKYYSIKRIIIIMNVLLKCVVLLLILIGMNIYFLFFIIQILWLINRN